MALNQRGEEVNIGGSLEKGAQRMFVEGSGPPDLDRLLKRFWSWVTTQSSSRTGKFWSSTPPKYSSATRIGGILVVMVFIWVLWGLHIIKESMKGVVTRLGAFHRIEEPGLNWRAPLFEKLTTVDVSSTKDIKAAGEMLTQDENIVDIQLTVRYQITNPKTYLYHVVDAQKALQQATDSALRYVIGHTSMDEILTHGREKVRVNTERELNQIIAAYDMGIALRGIDFESARPPAQVQTAFDAAIAAQEEQQRLIREAEAYAKKVEPKARGKAHRIEAEAEAYKGRILLEAEGELMQLQSLLSAYQKAPELVKNKLCMETWERLLSKVPKVMIDAQNAVPLLNIDQRAMVKGLERGMELKENRDEDGRNRESKLILDTASDQSTSSKETHVNRSSAKPKETRRGRFTNVQK